MLQGVWLFGAGLVGAYLAYVLFAREARDRIISQGISLQARLRYQQAATSPWTVVENFTCGWLNVLLKYMWPGFLSNIATGITAAQLTNLFNRLSRQFGSQPIFRVMLSQLVLREVSLGATPPRIDNATVRLHPNESMLEFEVDVDWVTSGMKLIVDALVAVSERQWNMKLIGVELILRGRMLFVLHLSQTVLPGISAMHFSFVRKPHLTFDINLKGVMFSEVPGLVSELKRRLLAVISAEAVEPARVFVDLTQPFFNLVTRKQGGLQGQLKVTLLRGTDLKPAQAKSAPAAARDSEACQCFVELRTIGRNYVSPIAAQGGSPVWGWVFWLPADDLPTADGAFVLRFTAINFMARHAPQSLGEGTLNVADFDISQLSQREPLVTKVRLKAPKGYAGGGGVLHVALHYEPTTAKVPGPPSGPGATSTSGASAGGASANGAVLRNGSPDRTVAGADRRVRQTDSAAPAPGSVIGGLMGLPPLRDVPEDEPLRTGGGSSEDPFSRRNGSATGAPADLASLSALAKSDAREKELRERDLLSESLSHGGTRDHTHMHSMSHAAAQRRIEHLERALALETQRRHEEELRALLEGAPFILHRGSDRTQRHVWVAESGEQSGAMLRWQSHKGFGWSRGRANRANISKVQYHEAAVALINSVTYGHELFPETQFQRQHAKTKPTALPKDQCFSLLLNVRGDHDADEVTVALHLEVPPAGNGRSRNEWVSAFNSLMCCKLPIYQQAGQGQSDGDGQDQDQAPDG